MKKAALAFIIVLFTLAGNAQTDTSGVNRNITSTPVKVPNTSVTMTPPLYFKASDKFNGFMHDGAGATIQITETEGKPYPYMAQAMANEENLKKQGITLISQEKVTTTSGKPGIMIVIGFSVKGPTQTFNYERIVFLTGDYNKTIIVNANYPVAAKEILSGVLKQSLLTVNY